MTTRLDVQVHDDTSRGACVAFAWVNALLAINPLTRWPGDRTASQWALEAHERIVEHARRPDGAPHPLTAIHGARIHREAGLVEHYELLRNVDRVLDALELGPVVAGLPWFEGMAHPGPDHRVRPIGDKLGGHAVALVERRGDLVRLRNCHGEHYGAGGDAWIHVADLADIVPLGHVVGFR